MLPIPRHRRVRLTPEAGWLVGVSFRGEVFLPNACVRESCWYAVAALSPRRVSQFSVSGYGRTPSLALLALFHNMHATGFWLALYCARVAALRA